MEFISSLIRLLYRFPLIYLFIRILIAYLVGLLSISGIKLFYKKELRLSQSQVNFSFIIIVMFIILFISYLLSCTIFQFLFGYFQSMIYNPLQILVPIFIAISIHFYYFQKRLSLQNRFKKIQLYGQILVFTMLFLYLFTTPLIFLGSTNYDWYKEYLSKKYGIVDQNYKSVPYLKPVSNEPNPPLGLVIKYLVFGERSVDCSSLND